MKIDSSLRPFEKKSFYLDLNGFPQEASLIKNLKLLGARHEPVFSKYVSFVVSNKVPLKSTPATWNQRPYSPLTPKSNGICPSPQLLSDCPMDYLDSSVYAVSPTTDQNPPSPKVQSRGMALLKKAAAISAHHDPPSPKVLSRGMALLKKATQKVKENQRATDLLENCKRWGIKVYHVDKILSKVKKYINLISAQYAKKKDLKKNNGKNKDECPPDVKKLLPPFIKFEDSNRKFRPVFQEFTSWTDVIDSSLSRNINQLNKLFKRTGALSDVARSIFTEINLNIANNLPRIHSLQCNESHSKSFTKLTETLKPSNSTSVQVSTVIHPMDREKENTVQRVKNQRYRKRAKALYCEICHKNYINLDEHINTEKHKKFMSNPMNFLAVQDVVTSLPKKGDHLLFKSYLNYESNNMRFSGSFFGDTGILPYSNTMYQPEIINTVYDPVFDINDLPTEPYSFLDPEIVSPSCSSPDLGPLPFLEDSLEKFPEKPLLPGDNILDFSKEKKSDFNLEIPMDCNKIAISQNECLNITENCISNDIIASGLPLGNNFTTTDVVNTLVEGSKYEEEPVLGNQISVTDATENVFAENYLHTESESCNNVKPQLCAQPFVVHLSNGNNLPEETLNNLPEKENCAHDSVLKDETNDSIKALLEVQRDSSEAQVAFDSVDVNICGKRKKRKPNGTANSNSRLKQKRRKVTSKSTNCSIKKTETEVAASVQSCNSTDYNVSSVHNNLFSQSLLYAQAESPVSEETCDSQDSAIVVHTNYIYLKTFPTLQNNAENASKSVSEAFEICSETAQTFEKVNPNYCTIKRASIESNTESLLHSQVEIISEETCDSQDSAIVVPLNDIDATAVTTLQNSAENIPESASEAFHICSETAMAFEIVNPKDCKKRKSIESNTSDSEDLNYHLYHEMFQNSTVDSGIGMPPPYLLHSVLNSSFQKCAEKEAELSLNLDNNSSVVSVNSCNSANCYASSIDLPVQRYSDEKERESAINLDKNCSLDVFVNSCISANCYSSGIDCPYESKDTTVHLEDESTYLCQAEVDTSVNYIQEDTSVLEVHSVDDSGLETSATQTIICPEQDKRTVSEPVNVPNCPGDNLSLCNKHNYLNNIHPKCLQISENEDNDSINFVEENEECSLEIPHHDFDNEAVKINNLVCNDSSSGDQSLIMQKTSNLEIKVTDLVEKKNKSSKCTVRKQIQYTFISTFLAENKYFSVIYGNKLQLLHISGIEFHECLFICSLSHCLAGSEEISAAETLKLQECLISVDSTIKISSVKQNPAYHSLDMLKESYSSKRRWNLLLVKMEDLKLESGFIGLILEKCHGKALITLSSMGNKSSISKNFTTSPKPNSPVFMTILFPYQDTTIHDKFGNKNVRSNSFSSVPLNSSSLFICDIGVKDLISSKDEIIRNSTNNSLAKVCSKSLVVHQPLNLCTKESEQIDMNPLQTSTIIPQLNPYLIDTVDNLASYSSFENRLEFPSDDCCSYKRIAKQLSLASSNLQYIESISVCSSDCEVNCCKPCTCDLGGGKRLPQTCNKFHYIETSSMDSSDNEWTLSHELVTTKQDLFKFLSKPILELNNITPKISYEIPSTSDFIGNTCLPHTYNNFQCTETNSMDSSDNEWPLPNKQAIAPRLNVSKFLNNPLLEFNERTPKINNYEELCGGETYETSPLSPLYVVIDDADYESDDEWDTIKSEVDNVCREFCDNEQH